MSRATTRVEIVALHALQERVRRLRFDRGVIIQMDVSEFTDEDGCQLPIMDQIELGHRLLDAEFGAGAGAEGTQ